MKRSSWVKRIKPDLTVFQFSLLLLLAFTLLGRLGGIDVLSSKLAFKSPPTIIGIRDLSGQFRLREFSSKPDLSELLENYRIRSFTGSCLLNSGTQLDLRRWEELSFLSGQHLLSLGERIPLNQAERKDLVAISGIGSQLADKIVRYRSQIKHFDSLVQLKSVSGIGDRIYKKIRGSLRLNFEPCGKGTTS